MKRWRPPFERPTQAAREALALRGIASPDAIDLEALAADLYLTVRRARIGNAEGRLLRSGWRGIVTLDEAAFASEKWRFVLAHEIGHFLLHANRDELACFPKASATRAEKSRGFLDEEAASQFAVELLAPHALVSERLDADATPFERACVIAATFGVSLPTAALRVLDFAPPPCAVAYSEHGVIRWCTATPSFALDVRTRRPLPERSVAHEVRAGRDVRGAGRILDPATWGLGRTELRAIREHSVVIPPFDAVITMLWHEETLGRGEIAG